MNLHNSGDRSSRPREQPNRTDPEREELIHRLRRCRLTGPQTAQALKMPRSTVAAVLKRAGMTRLRDLEPKPPVRRYERSRPGELTNALPRWLRYYNRHRSHAGTGSSTPLARLHQLR